MEKRWTTSRTDGNGTPEELWSSCDGVRLQLRLALSLGLLVSYATLARLLQICCGALDLGGSGDAGRIKRSFLIPSSEESGNLNSWRGLGAIEANLARLPPEADLGNRPID